jgi:predicted O-methyltransferase YrrM
MTQTLWTAVDDFIVDHLVQPDDALDAALRASEAAGLPAINVSPAQGKLLMLLAKLVGARSILEVGTLGGYSTIWLARALPQDGSFVTLEVNPKHADVARSNVARAGLASVVDVRVGAALDTLVRLASEGRGPFDLVFIDADKENNPSYFEWALKLTRRGSLIIVDNVVRGGRVIEGGNNEPAVAGTRRLYERMASEPRVSATAIQTVGVKGYDGFAVVLVTG